MGNAEQLRVLKQSGAALGMLRRDSGKDLAIELREYCIPDFSNWKNQDAFEAEFANLLRDLRAREK